MKNSLAIFEPTCRPFVLDLPSALSGVGVARVGKEKGLGKMPYCCGRRKTIALRWLPVDGCWKQQG